MSDSNSAHYRYHKILWDQPVTVWKDFLEQRLTRVAMSGKGIKLCCPYHPDKTPSAYLYLDKKFFKCYASQCGKYTRDPIAFIKAAFSFSSYEEAFSVFRKFAGIKITLKAEDVKAITAKQKEQYRKQLIAEIVHEHLLNSWDNPPNERAKNAIEWLSNVRKVKNPASIQSLGLLPRHYDFKQAVLNKGGTEEDWESIDQLLANYLNADYMDSVVFIYAVAPDNVTSFKLRKYDDIEKTDIRVIKSKGDPIGYFGLLNRGYVDYLTAPGANIDTAYVVEGEFDQLAVYQGQINQNSYDSIFLCTGGSGHAGLDGLASLGLTKIHIIGDEDDAGNKFPEALLEKTTKQNHKIFIWPSYLKDALGQSVDPDSCINKRNGFTKTYSALVDENNYLSVPQWAEKNIEEQLKTVNNPTHTDIKQKALYYLDKIKTDETASKELAHKIASKHSGITSQDLIGDLQASSDTPSGFVIRVREYLENVIKVLYHDTERQMACLWHIKNQTRIYYEYCRSPAVALKQFEIEEAQPDGLINWVKSNIGLPPFYPDPEENTASYNKTVSNLRSAVGEAIEGLVHGATNKKELQMLGPGTHYFENDKYGYILTGKDVYKFTYTDDNKPKKSERLAAPVHNGFSFDLTYDGEWDWLPVISSANDIFAKPTYDIDTLFKLIHELENKAFEYVHQDASVLMSSLMPFYSYMCCGYPRSKAVIYILGEHGSGKSAWMSMHLNGFQLPGYNLTYAGYVTANYISDASIRNNLKGVNGILLGIDEAVTDDRNPKRSAVIQNFLQMIRPLQTEGKARITRTGENNGKGADYMYSPIVMASDTLPSNSMDQSRLYTIEMKKNPNRNDLQTLLKREFKNYSMDVIRRDIFLHSMRMLPYYQETVNEVLNELENSGMSTAREMTTPVLLCAISKLMGQNYMDNFTTFTEAVKDSYEVYQKESPGDELLHYVCNSKVIPAGDTDISFMRALRDPDHVNIINNSDTGIYFYPKHDLLVVNWNQYRQNPQIRTTPIGRKSAVSLSREAPKSQYYCSNRDFVKDSRVADYLKKYGLSVHHSVSVFQVSHLVREAEEAREQLSDKENNLSSYSDDGGLEGVNL